MLWIISINCKKPRKQIIQVWMIAPPLEASNIQQIEEFVNLYSVLLSIRNQQGSTKLHSVSCTGDVHVLTIEIIQYRSYPNNE